MNDSILLGAVLLKEISGKVWCDAEEEVDPAERIVRGCFRREAEDGRIQTCGWSFLIAKNYCNEGLLFLDLIQEARLRLCC